MKRVSAVLLVLAILLSVSGCKETKGPLRFDDPPIPEQRLNVVVSETNRMFIEHPPLMVGGGDERFVYDDQIKVQIGGRTVREVFVFHGLDRGDIVEMDTSIYIDNVAIFLRSEHKEDLAAFNSWQSQKVFVSGQTVRIAVSCRVTGVNTILNRLAARPHWGIWLTFE